MKTISRIIFLCALLFANCSASSDKFLNQFPSYSITNSVSRNLFVQKLCEREGEFELFVELNNLGAQEIVCVFRKNRKHLQSILSATINDTLSLDLLPIQINHEGEFYEIHSRDVPLNYKIKSLELDFIEESSRKNNGDWGISYPDCTLR